MNDTVLRRPPSASLEFQGSAGVQRVTLSGGTTGSPERLAVPAMGFLVALLYGVDLLFGCSPVGLWFEFCLSSAVLLLGRVPLKRGLEKLIYRLQPDGETLLSLAALGAFAYSFVAALLHSLGRLSPDHLSATAPGELFPDLYFTTAGAVVFGATLARTLLERAEHLLAERRENQWHRVAALESRDKAPQLPRGWASRSRLAATAERIGAYWALMILLLVLLTGARGFVESTGLSAAAILSVITFLVATAPNAFFRAVRATETCGGIEAGARGFFLRAGRALERLAQTDVVCFSKLGTLTVGCPQVTDVVPLKTGVHADEILYLASVLEAQTEHPYREAVLFRLSESSRTMPRVRGFRTVAGRGLRAVFQGQEMVFGSPSFLEELGIACSDAREQIEPLAADGKTVLVLAKASELLGLVAVADERRSEVGEAVAALRSLGVRTALLSGDSRRTVETVAADAGFDDVHAEVSRQQWVSAVKEIKGRGLQVAVVTSGLSGCVSLGDADLGIAFGVGKDALLESADVIVNGQDLREIPRLVRLARQSTDWIRTQLVGLFALQAAVLGVVVYAGLDLFLFRDPGAVGRGGYLLGWPYFADGLGFAMALLPAAMVWLSCAALRRFERLGHENTQAAERG